MRINSVSSILILVLAAFSQMRCSQLPQSTQTETNLPHLKSEQQTQWQHWVDKYDKGRRSDSGW